MNVCLKECDEMRSVCDVSHTNKHTYTQDAVNNRNVAGRKLRRKVIAGSVMVFVTAGYSGKRFIFEKAHQLGIKSVVLDAPDR